MELKQNDIEMGENSKSTDLETLDMESSSQTHEQNYNNSKNSGKNQYMEPLDLENTNMNKDLIKYERYFGNNFVFCFYKQEPLFSIGPHWPMFLCTFTIFGFAGFLITKYVAVKRPAFFYYGEIVMTGLLLLFYLLTAIVNPGITTARSREEELAKKGQKSFCSVCKIQMDQDIYHCYDCEVCIEGYDHHCPWTGKCIGKGNLTFFKLFIGFLCGFFVFSMVVAVARPDM